jgi:hypothetical protein
MVYSVLQVFHIHLIVLATLPLGSVRLYICIYHLYRTAVEGIGLAELDLTADLTHRRPILILRNGTRGFV